MNKERLNYLADVIENATLPGVKFNMSTYGEVEYEIPEGKDTYKPCGTACCIAGHAWMIAGGSVGVMSSLHPDELVMSIKATARNWLDLTSEEAYQLFNPAVPVMWSALTKEHAVKVLRNAAETGVIKW